MTEEKLLRFVSSTRRVQEVDLAEKPVSGFLYDRETSITDRRRAA